MALVSLKTQRLLSCRPMKGSGSAHPQSCEFWPIEALQLAEGLLFQALAEGTPDRR